MDNQSAYNTGYYKDPNVALRMKNTCVLLGESMTGRNHLVQQVGSTAAVVGDGVKATFTVASSAVQTGSRLNFTANQGNVDFDSKILVATNVDVNTFTVPSALVGNPVAIPLWNNQTRWSERGWFTWMNAYLGQRLWCLNNAAIGSETIEQHIARFYRDVAPYAPEFVFCKLGVNNIASQTPAQVLALAIQVFNLCFSINAVPIAKTISPLHPSFTNFATIMPRITQYNYLLRNWCAQNGVTCIDDFGAVTDTAQADGRAQVGAIQGTAGDFIHYSAFGARLDGKNSAAIMSPLIAPVSALTNSQADTYGSNASNLNLIDQSPWAASGGTVNAPCTGTLPTGFTITRTVGTGACACSVPARTVIANGDAIGNNVRLVMTSSAAADAFQLQWSADVAARFVAGNTYKHRFSLTFLNSVGSNLFKIFHGLLLNASGQRGYVAALDTDASPTVMPYEDGTYWFETAAFTVPAAPSSGFFPFTIFTFNAAGSAITVDLGRSTLIQVN